ncbi:NAD-dependent epimerase/dehydratase family protein [Oligoflexus tunisiensis]|uniref:NAD-dependent epimerase/dehydratase family protein n=1 Tax=Oligoflexus tunisiensis TaxID=708132 RepID=UPI000AAC5D8E|nr:NAD-dependent epimerase/dehydratase family protein [Oligoflexus tunisiensis]
MTETGSQRKVHTILGAGGAIGHSLWKELKATDHRVRRVHPSPEAGPDSRSADLARRDEAIAAIEGSDVVYLLLDLQYDTHVWEDQWPSIMRHVIEGCKRHGARLIFFDNVCMYGQVRGPMTEDTPYNPCSKKGEIRARIATELLQEVQSGHLQALIARSADFYGPHAVNGIPNTLVFDQLIRSGKALCLADDQTKHSYAYTRDASRGLILLAQEEDVWNQVWHLPTATEPYTGRAFIEEAARELGLKPKSFILRRWMTRVGGAMNPLIREIEEMIYQHEIDYIVDSTKICQRFNITPTPYRVGIQETAQALLARRS